MPQKTDLTTGPITTTMLRFALPMILGNLLQQFYNVADTFIVGQFLGAGALAAVGSSYTLMTFLTSILLGMSMGSGAVFSIRYGEREMAKLKNSMVQSFVMIAGFTLVLNLLVFLLIDPMMGLLSVPDDVYPLMRDYLWVIFFGIGGTFLVQLFRLPAAGGGQLRRTPAVFGRLRGAEHCAGCGVCGGRPLGRGRGSLCHLPFPVGVRAGAGFCTPGSKCPSFAPAGRISGGERKAFWRSPGFLC